MSLRTLWRFWFPFVFVLGVLLELSTLAHALSFTQDFESWNLSQCSSSNDPFGPDCFHIFGCPNNANLMIRHLNNLTGSCYLGVSQWALSYSIYHNGTSASGSQIASEASNHTVPPYFDVPMGRYPNSVYFGNVQVDMQIHGAAPYKTSSEHYVLFSQMQLANNGCSSYDCYPDTSTITKKFTGFVGAIWGSFGDPDHLRGVGNCNANGYNCLGFVAESGATGYKDPNTFIPYDDGNGYFPANRWYRVYYSLYYSGGYYHTLTAKYYNGSSWVTIGTKTASAPLAFQGLTGGYVGFLTASSRTQDTVHYDWDNLTVNW